MNVGTALRQGRKLLEEAAVAAPRLTAEVLLCHALRRERSYLYGHPEHELTDLEQLHFGRYLHERLAGKPTQYITGRQEFYGREFRVTSDVLIPRPETEHVVEAALGIEPRPRAIADIGTGSGALAVTLQLETGAAVVATDISLAALEVAKRNADTLGAKVNFVACDIAGAIAAATQELVACNPPYVPLAEERFLQREVREHEPRIALFGGESGLEIYRRVIGEAARILRPGGRLILELGFTSRDGVLAMLDERWEEVEAKPDLAGIPRVLLARLR